MMKKSLCLLFVLVLIAQTCAGPTEPKPDEIVKKTEEAADGVKDKITSAAEDTKDKAQDIGKKALAAAEEHIPGHSHDKKGDHDDKKRQADKGDHSDKGGHGDHGSHGGHGARGGRPISKLINQMEKTTEQLTQAAAKSAEKFFGFLHL